MRITTFYSILAAVFFGLTAHAKDHAGLTISAAGYQLTNDLRQLHLTIQLVNITNHDITVLTKQKTKHPAMIWIPINDTTEPKKLLCQIGLSDVGTWDGHLIVPSLPNLAPVTLKPNEAAIIHIVIDQNEDSAKVLRSMTRDTEIIVQYKVLPQWGERFACWSGEVFSTPFKATLATTTVKKP